LVTTIYHDPFAGTERTFRVYKICIRRKYISVLFLIIVSPPREAKFLRLVKHLIQQFYL
jgi:hypothetical protein